MTIQALWRLSRPHTLSAAIVPVLVGVAAGALGGKPSFLLALDMLVISLLLQIATNMANEYFDFRRGVDHAGLTGIAGVIVKGELQAKTVLHYALGTFLLAFFLGCVLGYIRGLILIGLGLLSILVALLYSAGPKPIAATPYGELTVFLLMGVLETLVSEVAAVGRMSAAGLAASFSVGFLVAAILTANNLRDRESDQERGRRTLAIVLGEVRGLRFLRAEALLALLWPAMAALLGLLPWAAALTLLLLPLAAGIGRGVPLRRLLPQTSRLHLLNGVFLAAGLALWLAVR
ncbi:MAG: 1,4-dihydroxy-2-naphthoate octaprenyltransferase [Thermaerobacter sp.]|nr:1,4-dihydroxy-2-naphthoate octaprenyltransferase [Thermaerobacter sp.]